MPSDHRAVNVPAFYWVPGVGKIEPLSVKRGVGVWFQMETAEQGVSGLREWDQSWKFVVEWSDDGTEVGRRLGVVYEGNGEFGVWEGDSQNEGFQPEADAKEEEEYQNTGFDPANGISEAARQPGMTQGGFDEVKVPGMTQGGFNNTKAPQTNGSGYQNHGYQPPAAQPQAETYQNHGYQPPVPQPQDNGYQNHGYQPPQPAAAPSNGTGLWQGGFHDTAPLAHTEESQNVGYTENHPAPEPEPESQNIGFQDPAPAPVPQYNGFAQGGFHETVPAAGESQNEGFHPTNGQLAKLVKGQGQGQGLNGTQKGPGLVGSQQKQTGSRMKVTMMNGFF
jgi:hypothetical protein